MIWAEPAVIPPSSIRTTTPSRSSYIITLGYTSKIVAVSRAHELTAQNATPRADNPWTPPPRSHPHTIPHTNKINSQSCIHNTTHYTPIPISPIHKHHSDIDIQIECNRHTHNHTTHRYTTHLNDLNNTIHIWYHTTHTFECDIPTDTPTKTISWLSRMEPTVVIIN